jgi:DamX protein
LLAAFAENTHTVNRQHVKAAIRDCEFSHYASPAAGRGPGFIALALGIGALLGIGLLSLAQYFQRAPTSAESIGGEPSYSKIGPETAALTPPLSTNATTPRSTTPATNSEPPSVAAPTTDIYANKSAEKIPKPSEKPPVAPSPTAQISNDNLIQTRLRAGAEWLASAGNNALTIQLLGADNPQQLKNHLNVIAKYVEINEVFVYRTMAKQKPSMTVSYGSFADRGAAQEALNQLPPALKATKPILRTAQGIRTEIAQNQSP